MRPTDQLAEKTMPSVEAPSEELIGRCQALDLSAREELARYCIPRIQKTVFFMTRSGEEIDDITQTALMMVFSGLESYGGRSSFGTWLDRVTTNAVKQYFRAKRAKSWLFFYDEPVYPQSPERDRPDRRTEGQRLMDSLSVHLQSIKPRKRLALVLSAVYGYSTKEIATIVGCTTDAAKKRVQHGRRELLAKLADDRYLSTALREIPV